MFKYRLRSPLRIVAQLVCIPNATYILLSAGRMRSDCGEDQEVFVGVDCTYRNSHASVPRFDDCTSWWIGVNFLPIFLHLTDGRGPLLQQALSHPLPTILLRICIKWLVAC